MAIAPLSSKPIVFRENVDTRLYLFPIRLQEVWKFFKKAEASFWTTEEIDLATDAYDQLEDGEKRALNYVLAFFSFGDGLVNETLVESVLKQVECKEVRKVYIYQTFIESIHEETYGELLRTYIKDPAELETLQRAVIELQSPRLKAEWMRRWGSPSVPFVQRLVAYAIVEGVLFSSSFAIIFWLKGKSSAPMSGLFFSNELISRDEGMHCDFAVMLHHMLFDPKSSVSASTLHEHIRNIIPSCECRCGDEICFTVNTSEEELAQLISERMYPDDARFQDPALRIDIARSTKASFQVDQDTAYKIMKSAIEVEDKFIDEALPIHQLNMNAGLMKQYVRFCADRLLFDLGFEKFYTVANPFPFMEMINLEGKTNFFEKRNSQYQLAGVNVRKGEFSLDADF